MTPPFKQRFTQYSVGYTHSINDEAELFHSWNDKRHWWQSPCTVNLLPTGIRWYGIDLFKAKGQIEHLDWTSIHTRL